MIYLEVALVIFLVVFLGVVAWVALAKPGRFHDAARIPLHEEPCDTEPRHGTH